MNRINWESDLPIWKSFGGNKPCHLCGEPDAPVYKKGHSRQNGIMLEASQLYCRNCDTNRKQEVDADFDKWWAEKWAECEAECEKNWQEYGIYGNCWDGEKNQPSTHFGYVKNPNGTFIPYRFAHPETDWDRFEGALYFEADRIGKLSISDEEKFLAYREFVKNFESQNKKFDRYRNGKIEGIDEFLKENDDARF